MNSLADSILISGINPFDRSYHHHQQVFDSQILQLITEILLLKVIFVKTPLITDISSYEKNPDNWILEQIVNGSAEMSSTTIILSPESQNTVSYSFGISTFSVELVKLATCKSIIFGISDAEEPQLYYKARSLREEHNIYLTPFSSNLWICLMATAFLLIIALTFILSRETKLPHEISYDVLARIIDVQQDQDEIVAQNIQSTPKELLSQKEKWELGEILLICLGAACQQGSARDPSTNAARILILCLFVLALVGYTAYSASVISLVSLYLSTEHEQIENTDYFSRQYDTLLYNINEIKDLHLDFSEIGFSNLKNGFDKTLQGKAVFVGDRDISLTFLHQQNYNANLRCTLGKTFLGVEYHRVLALKKNSQYKDKINHIILSLKQFGLLNRERRRIFNIESACNVKEKVSISNFISFNINDVRPLINIFILGLLISFLLLIVENMVNLMFKWKIKNFVGIKHVDKKQGKKCSKIKNSISLVQSL